MTSNSKNLREPIPNAGPQMPLAAVLFVHANGLIHEAGPDAEALFRSTADRAKGRAFVDFVPFWGSGETEGWCHREDGSRFFGMIAALPDAPQNDAAESEVQLRSLCIVDITSRYERAEVERYVRQRIDQIATSVAHVVFFSIDFEQDDVQVWGGLAEVIGWTEGTPPRRLSELLQLVHADDHARLTQALDHAATNSRQLDIEFRIHSDLGERWLRVVGSFVDDVAPRVVGAGMNVTEQITVQQALRASEAKFQAVLNATIDGILTIDADGKIASFNETAATMFRHVDNTLRGMHWRTLLDIPSATLPVSGTLLDVTARRGPGATFVVECGFTEIVVGDERQVVVVARDVTQRRALERQVLDVSEQLQRQIGQDLHDGLGQLLTGTAFLAKSLQRSIGPEYQTQALRVVELVNQAIARVRILARGLSPIHVEAQTLEAVLRSVVNESRELLGIRCALFHDLNVDSARPATVSQLCLITREAITNAVRHGQAGRVDVRLRQEAGHALLEIEDDGVGINTDEAAEEGLGIRSMRYRARIIGGNLSITRTETGTLVRCAWTE